MTLGPLDEGPSVSEDPASVLTALGGTSAWELRTPTRSITTRMQLVATKPAFSSVGASLVIGDDTPQRLADVALRLYASTDDFTALHGVTGLEAISRLRLYVDDVEKLDRASFQALAAAYLTIGAPNLWSSDRLKEMAATTTLDDDVVKQRAAFSGDEHVAKIVFTSMRRMAECGDPLYGAVAERAVRNDETAQSGEGSPAC